MSKRDNTLLSENQIRKFMKLAELTPLADGFVEGLREDESYTTRLSQHLGPPKGKKKASKRTREHESEGEEKSKGKGEFSGDPEMSESHGRSPREGARGRDDPDQNSRNEAADPEALEDYALGDEERGEPEEALEDELEADDELGLEDEPLEDELEPGEDRTVSVDDFLAALEVALEDVLGDEVEVEQEEEEEVELAPDEEEIELGDIEVEEEEEELELQEMVNVITKRVAKRIVKEALKKK